MDCNWCHKAVSELYELRNREVCFDCYFEDVDKTLGEEEIEETK